MTKIVSLNVNCPHCNKSLMDDKHLINNRSSIKILIEVATGQKGNIWLSSIYGDYNYTCDVKIPEGEIAIFHCPHCQNNLKRKKVECDICHAPIVSFNCSIGGHVSICSRNGCKNHYIVFENVDTAIRKFYDEYGYH